MDYDSIRMGMLEGGGINRWLGTKRRVDLGEWWARRAFKWQRHPQSSSIIIGRHRPAK